MGTFFRLCYNVTQNVDTFKYAQERRYRKYRKHIYQYIDII